MSRAAPSDRRPSAAAAIAVAAAVGVALPPSGATEPAGRPRAEVWLEGATEPDATRAREVVDELLARAGVAVVWKPPARFRPEDLLETAGAAPAHGAAAARVWIDVSSRGEARLYLGDAASERFVVRRLPLPGGLDEIGREQIARIVASAVEALLWGAEPLLSRSEARTAIVAITAPAVTSTQPPRQHEDRPPPPRSPEPPPAPWRFEVEIGPRFTVEAFARDPLVASRAGAAIGALFSAPPPSEAPAAAVTTFELWSEVGAELPLSYEGRPVALDLGATSARAGVGAGRTGGGPRPRWSWRLSLGGGADRVTFRPRGDPGAVEIAPEGRFLAPMARAGLSVALRPWRRLWLGAGLSCDVSLTEIHYDLQDSDGQTRRYVTPYRVRPALSLGASWRF